MSVFPGMAICVAVLGLNLFADGRDRNVQSARIGHDRALQG